MVTWLAPFATLLVVVALYAASKGTPRREAMVSDLNFYIVCVMAVSIMAIIAGARLDRDWTDTGTWVLAAIASIAILLRWKSGSSQPPQP